MIQIIDCDQGTDEWHSARLGIPTASCFATVMAKGKDGGASKTRADYMRKLAGEVLTGRPMDSYSNGHMERGKEREPDARNMYSFMRDVDPQCVGFIRNGQKGCSPDSLVNDDGGLEIKSAAAHIQVERLLTNKLPAEHRAQVQGCIWIAEREWWDFVSYCPGLPLLVVREFRDDEYVAKLAEAVAAFNDELDGMVERVRRLSGASQVRQQLVESVAA
jgi:hypothetical protein